MLMRCCLRLRRRKQKSTSHEPRRHYPRWLFVGRSLGLAGRLWRLILRTPIAPLGHSLRCVRGRPSAAPAVTSVPDAAADPSSRHFRSTSSLHSSLQGGLVPLR
ncbi:MAG: hypothetical protein P8O22_06025 [Akkermansiaceae bacterium]|nr:hypothetical protein [Akkermansiaceae bacterium]